jgi:aminoglycoside phosphotransferase
LAEAVAPDARVTRLRRLAGAGMTDAFDVTLDRAPHRVVAKLYRDGDGTAPLEWSRLEFARRVALPVPEPIVADLEPVWFGRPTVVMSRLPGRPDLTPRDPEAWVGALAQALVTLHETPVDAAEGAVVLPSLGVHTARTGRRRSPHRRLLGHPRRHL